MTLSNTSIFQSDHDGAPSANLTGSKVICAMSGGVDSSATALLLIEAGCLVAGVTMRLFDPVSAKAAQACDEDASPGSTSQTTEPAACGSSQDALDARAAAEKLGVEHCIIDFSAEFAECVIDPFCRSYLQGMTPNPCVRCNRAMKFGALHRHRKERGFDYVATGHYARRCYHAESGRYLLKTALDPSKDQSYVLYSLTQEDLAHTLFPLGELTKPQVRAIAQQAGLANAQKAESQDICFIPDGDYLGFIRRRTGTVPQPGPIVHVDGTVLGTHQGLAAYTIGQRKGIGIAWSEPLYVCGKDPEGNKLIVGTKEEALVTKVFVDQVNLISVERMDRPMEVTVKTYYRQKPQAATAVQAGPNSVELTFAQPIRACAADQAAVFYQGDVVVGGGTIAGCS